VKLPCPLGLLSQWEKMVAVKLPCHLEATEVAVAELLVAEEIAVAELLLIRWSGKCMVCR
jgi:hypothetical protein